MVEAKRRDHRVLGKKLDLFSLQEDAGGGLVSQDSSAVSAIYRTRRQCLTWYTPYNLLFCSFVSSFEEENRR